MIMVRQFKFDLVGSSAVSSAIAVLPYSDVRDTTHPRELIQIGNFERFHFIFFATSFLSTNTSESLISHIQFESSALDCFTSDVIFCG